MNGWLAYHFYYHGDRDLLLRDLLAPLLADWLAERSVESFFFVRYPLGGNHVRFRFLPGAESEVAFLERDLQERAALFFGVSPSVDRFTQQEIATHAEALLARESTAHLEAELAGGPYLNNSVHRQPFLPEVERYGGEKVLAESFRLFAVSSLRALAFLESPAAGRRARLLTAGLALLAEQAAGFARSPAELVDLLQYASEWPGIDAAPLAEKADRFYQAQGTILTSALGQVVEQAISGATPLARGTFGLRRRLDLADLPEAKIREIGHSHLHMTANRIGLSNVEEVYLSQIALRCTEAWASEKPPFDRAFAQAGPGDLQEAHRAAVEEFLGSRPGEQRMIGGSPESYAADLGAPALTSRKAHLGRSASIQE